MVKIIKKTIYLCVMLFALSGNVFALDIDEEIKYYREIKKPLEEFLEELKNFVGDDNSGIFFRTVNNKVDYSATNYFAAHYNELYDFYAEKLFCLKHFNIEDPFLIENKESLEIRQNIIDAIDLMVDELKGLSEAYLLPEKLDKISKMSQPNVGYKGTLKLFQKIRIFIEKHLNMIIDIYDHEKKIIDFMKLKLLDNDHDILKIDQEDSFTLSEVLKLPTFSLNLESLRFRIEKALIDFDEVRDLYTEKLIETIGRQENEKEQIEIKEKRSSILSLFSKKKEEVKSIEPKISTDGDLKSTTTRKRSTSLLKSLSPRSRSISQKTLNLGSISPKIVNPRKTSPKSKGEVLNRGASDSKLSPKTPISVTPRPKSEEGLMLFGERSKSLFYAESDEVLQQDLIIKEAVNSKKVSIKSDKVSPVVSPSSKKVSPDVSPRVKKEAKKEKKIPTKKSSKSSKPVDKIQLPGLYGISYDE